MPQIPDADVHLLTQLNKFYNLYNKLAQAIDYVDSGYVGKQQIMAENALIAKAPSFHSWREDRIEAEAAFLELVGKALKTINKPPQEAPRLSAVNGKTKSRSVKRRRPHKTRKTREAVSTVPNVFIDLDEASRVSGISRSAITTMIHNGEIPKEERADNRLKISMSTLVQIIGEKAA